MRRGRSSCCDRLRAIEAKLRLLPSNPCSKRAGGFVLDVEVSELELEKSAWRSSTAGKLEELLLVLVDEDVLCFVVLISVAVVVVAVKRRLQGRCSIVVLNAGDETAPLLTEETDGAARKALTQIGEVMVVTRIEAAAIRESALVVVRCLLLLLVVVVRLARMAG